MSETVVNGSDVFCFLEGEAVAHATSHNLRIQTEVVPISNKEDLLFTRIKPGRFDASASCEGLIAYGDFEAIEAAMESRLPVTLVFGKQTGGILDTSEKYFTGKFLITGFEMVAQDGNIATYNVSFIHEKDFEFVGLATEEMKYLQTINLTGGVENDITTTLATEPYSIMLLDSSGNFLSADVTIQVTLSGGFYHILIYSVDSLNTVKLKILY